MNILGIGAHFDDIELGCGGTLATHVENGDRVWTYVATHSGYQDPSGKVIRDVRVAEKEGKKAADILGVTMIGGNFETNNLLFTDKLVCAILSLVEKFSIDTIYTHWIEDVHQDHFAVGKASIAAGRHVPRVLMYRSNDYDSKEAFTGTYYVDITSTIETKQSAIKAHQSELKRVNGIWLENSVARSRLVGSQFGVAHAESFQIVKYLSPR